MIISISGRPGSGKSTVGQALAQALGWRRYAMGDLRRQMARDRGLSLEDFNRLGETQQFTDQEVDDYQRQLGLKEDNFIIEGRTSFHFIPQSYKVFLDCSLTAGATRIWRQLETEGNNRNEADQIRSLDDMTTSLKNRIASDDQRYRKYYNLNVNDLSQYDLVIDTTNLSPSEVNQRLLEEVNKHVGTTKKISH
jgi:predicted cytidylate kinase